MASPSLSETLGDDFVMFSQRDLEQLLPLLLPATSKSDRFHGGTLLLVRDVMD